MKKILALVLVSLMVMCSVSGMAEVKLGQVQVAAHGTQCFAVITAAVEDDKVVAAWIDEFQVMSGEGVQGVPNSKDKFGANIVGNEDGKVLGSKRVNSAFYSGNMAAKAGSTQEIAVSWKAIEDFAVGKTIAELEAYAADKLGAQGVDVVSGATLVDTLGYLKGIIAAANVAAGLQTGHYTLYNQTGETVKEVYITDNATGDKGENLVGDGLAPDAVKMVTKTISAEIPAHHAVTFTYVTESGRVGEFATLSIEDVPLTLLSADAMTGATPFTFFAPKAE